jgi:phosphoserine phosphatase RsbU/P
MLAPGSANLGAISVFAHCLPCSELAGDFYDYVALRPDGAAIVVADVSWHGVSAAMLTGVVKSAFHSASSEHYEPACVVERIANGIRSFGHHYFITVICARVRNGSLDFVNAGHPPGILSNVTTAGALLGSTGPIISPALKSSWEQDTIQVERGSDRIVLFTDAIIEAESASGAYGLDRLIKEVSGRPPDGNVLSEQIMESVREFVGDRAIDDDFDPRHRGPLAWASPVVHS